MRIGYVGLGNMGGALAARLQQTHALHVYDLDADAVRRLVEKGATPCGSLPELASCSDVIVSCLPTSEHVRAAIFGDNGLHKGLARGSLIIDQTSGDPAATREMADELAVRGVDLVDAPVSGGPEGAEAGSIAIMVGASAEQYARARAVLSAISPNLFHAGSVGAGHVMKLVNNLLSGAQRLMSLEAMALAVKNGIEPRAACEILSAGGARNAYLNYLAPRLETGKFKLGFTLGLMHKDVRLACQLASDSGVPLFFGNLTCEYYQMCINEMGASASVQSVAMVVERLASARVLPVHHDLP